MSSGDPVASGHDIVNPPGLAPPAGFAHAVRAAPGRTVYLGGQTALDEHGEIAAGGIVEQFDLAAANVVHALEAAGGRPTDLVSLQIFTTDMDAYRAHLGDLGQAWRRHFGRHYPAMALLGVSRLFDAEALVELVGIAVLPGEAPPGG